MKTWLRYLWLVVTLVGAMVLWVFVTRHLGTPFPAVKNEAEAIRVQAAVEKIEAEKGRTLALRRVEEDYREALRKLEGEEWIQATKLRENPALLARFLVRVGSQRR